MTGKAVIYTFVGDGLGVPGLAREITREQAQADGVEALLDECLAAVVYVDVMQPPAGHDGGEFKVVEAGPKGRKGK